MSNDGKANFKILIADHDAPYRQALREALDARFSFVTIAESGPQVLYLCSRTDFDLVIVDNRLPGMLGIEVVRRLEQSLAPTQERPRLILTSSHETDPVIESALEYGLIDRFLKKPFTFAALLWEIEFLLGLRTEPHAESDDFLDAAIDDLDDEDEEDSIQMREINYDLPFFGLRAGERDSS